MTNTNSERPSEKNHVKDDNFDEKSVISVRSKKSVRSTKSARSTRSAAGGDSNIKNQRNDDERSSCCCCGCCPERNPIPPPKLKRDIECNNINEVVPPIIPSSPKHKPPSTTGNREKPSARAASPAPSVRSVKSVRSIKSIKENNERGEQPKTDKVEGKPIELRASVLMNYCECVKKNGLQDSCPRYKCQKPIYQFV